jgi:hypothetical protein
MAFRIIVQNFNMGHCPQNPTIMATNAVNIKANAKGVFVNVYSTNNEFGYIVLETVATSFEKGWIRDSKRTCLIRGTVKSLEELVAATKSLPGRIAVREYLEDEIPADIAKANLRDDVSFEEAIAPYLKRAGQDGVNLTKGGKRIVRFTEYDGAGITQDIIVSHDNIAEVAASKAEGAKSEDAPF